MAVDGCRAGVGCDEGAGTFDSRYSSLGFNGDASPHLGDMWPASFAITRLDQGRGEGRDGARDEGGGTRDIGC